MPYCNFGLYPNKYFIETGTYRGDGIQAALDANCFESIYSIEISEKYYEFSRKRFFENNKVQIFHGDSLDLLPKLIKDINVPITFWLDAHWSMGDTGKGEIPFPILLELYEIKNHPIKTHTLLIDDVRLFSDQWRFPLEDIIKVILLINPDYNIHYESGFVDNDVLIAEVK